MRQMRRSVALVLATLVLASCSRGERQLVEMRSPASISADGRTLTVGVESCNGGPTVELVERADTVIASVTSYVPRGDRDDCQDIVTIELQRPLGSRALVDGSNDAAVDLSS
jgi:hypothetical protein